MAKAIGLLALALAPPLPPVLAQPLAQPLAPPLARPLAPPFLPTQRLPTPLAEGNISAVDALQKPRP